MAKTAVIELDRTRTLRLNLYAQMRFERESGKKISELNNSATDLATMIWSCLVQDDPELTVDAVAMMIDVSNLDPINQAIDTLTGGEVPLAQTGENAGPSEDTTSA